MKKIIFISEIQDPYNQGSSTQIMTRNLLIGFRENNIKVDFIAIIDDDCDEENIKKYYKSLVNNIIIVKSILQLRFIEGKYKKLMKLLKVSNKKYKYKKIDELNLNDETLIISHSPSIESILIANCIKQKHKNIKYYQYWSDPISLSGIYPENMNYKRVLHKYIENKMLGYSDEIIYGTFTLYKHQKKLFEKFSSKMRYIDVSYSEDEVIDLNVFKYKLGYTGQYYSQYRNIKPLYNCIKENGNINLVICGDSDVKLESTNNIEIISKRYSQNDIKEIEKEIEIIVIILNSNCIQIPGKVFYHSNTKKPILVILDGKYKEEIFEYLKTFNRFNFCDNNETSINKEIVKIMKNINKNKYEGIEVLSPQYIVGKLCGIKE